MRLKRFIAIFISVAIIFTMGVSAFANEEQKKQQGGSKFKDVAKDHWANKAINWMVYRKIISGYPDSTFKPENTVTRAEFAKLMVLALDLPLGRTDSSTFRDIDRKNWALPYVETAKLYLTGFRTSAGDYFRPDQPAVREDMAVALVKAKKLENETPDYSVLDVFTDKNSISANLKKYVAIAVKHEFMKGSPIPNSNYKQFKPSGVLTRAEASVLLYNINGGDKITYDEEKITYDGSTPPLTVTNDVYHQ